MSVTVFLAEDHQIVRQGLSALLADQEDFDLAGEAGEGLQTVRLVERLRPSVLVLDLMLPGLPGLEVIGQVRKLSPATKIVVLSMHSDAAYVVAAMEAGASAYVLKEAGADQLVLAIRKVLAGQQYFSPPLSPTALRNYQEKAESTSADPFASLTRRERTVLEHSVEGLSSAEIGQRLVISPRTVETHRANLMRKLGVRKLKELIRLVSQRGVVPDPGR